LEGRSRLIGLLSRRNTASHRCNTRLRALPLSLPRTNRGCRFHILFQKSATKNRKHLCGVSCKKSSCDDFLRRHYPHQVKGSKSLTSSQPAYTSSPAFNCDYNCTLTIPQLQVVVQRPCQNVHRHHRAYPDDRKRLIKKAEEL
jgi:hypothetical protein